MRLFIAFGNKKRRSKAYFAPTWLGWLEIDKPCRWHGPVKRPAGCWAAMPCANKGDPSRRYGRFGSPGILSAAKQKTPPAVELFVWLGWLESNQHGQSQSLLSYH